MELKVGQIITCKKERNVYKKSCLTIGKGYEITNIDEDYVTIIDDDGDVHEFSFIETSVKFVGKYFTTEPPKTERYFIVFYDGNTDIGYCEVITTDGQYVSQTQALSAITEHVGHENHSITNIIELNQQDYESWNK